MTGYTVHTGASKKFVKGWDRIFSGQDAASSTETDDKKSQKSKASGKKNKKAKAGKKTEALEGARKKMKKN
jgi:hypothetical protein